jgi:transposase
MSTSADWRRGSPDLEKKVDRCLDDLAKLEEEVQHIAAVVVSIVETAKLLDTPK